MYFLYLSISGTSPRQSKSQRIRDHRWSLPKRVLQPPVRTLLQTPHTFQEFCSSSQPELRQSFPLKGLFRSPPFSRACRLWSSDGYKSDKRQRLIAKSTNRSTRGLVVKFR